MFSWTFERERDLTNVGEYGTGFKSAAVNLAEKLTVMSHAQGRSFQAIADWQDMCDENRWEPVVMEISNDYFSDIHPFTRGTSFLLENLRYDIFCPLSILDKKDTMVTLLCKRLWDDVAYSYRYILYERETLVMTIRGRMSPEKEVNEHNVRDHDLFREKKDPFWKHEYSTFLTTQIHVYQDNLQFYHIYFQHANTQKWCLVEFVEKRKNGNSILKCHDISPTLFTNMRLVDTLRFVSVHVKHDQRSIECMTLYPLSSVDIVRHGRVMARDLIIRTPHQCHYFIKHEVWFQSYTMNGFLGIQYTKQNSGRLPENDVRYTLEYIQHVHEKEFQKNEKKTHDMPLSSPSSNSEDILDLTPAVPPSDDTRRKHFPSSTKIKILHQQECRDPILDFILKEPILLTEYDHKNGRPHINTRENCQALSVLTHSVKTRFPEFFQTLQTNDDTKIDYILDLLNCVTRSRFFIDAWVSGQVYIKTPQHSVTVIQDGLFSRLS